MRTDNISVSDPLTYDEVPVQILDRQERKLINKEIASVKVLWRSQSVESFTWEAELDTMVKYTPQPISY